MLQQHIFGTYKQQHKAVPVSVPVTAPSKGISAVMHYVVSNACASTMQGYKSNKCKNVKIYAVCNSLQKANAYIKNNNMRLYATVVTL